MRIAGSILIVAGLLLVLADDRGIGYRWRFGPLWFVVHSTFASVYFERPEWFSVAHVRWSPFFHYDAATVEQAR